MDSKSYLLAKDLTHSCAQGSEQTILLRGISYAFQQGVSYGLSGSSGSGKSTLLSLLSGLEVPSSGQVFFQGMDLFALPAPERQRITRQIGLVFQVPYLLDELSLIENIMIKGLIEEDDYESASERARALLVEVGLSGKDRQRPRSLSGGEQQRVCIARALFTQPTFILADEPTAHLDSTTAQDIMSILCGYQRVRGAGLLIASHDTAVLQMLDVMLKLEQGVLHSIPSVQAMVNRQQEMYG